MSRAKVVLLALSGALFLVGNAQSEEAKMLDAKQHADKTAMAEDKLRTSAKSNELSLDEFLENEDNSEVTVFELSKLPAPAAGKPAEKVKAPNSAKQAELEKEKNLGILAKQKFAGENID